MKKEEKTFIKLINIILLISNFVFAILSFILLLSSLMYLILGDWQLYEYRLAALAYSLFCIMCSTYFLVYSILSFINIILKETLISNYLIFFDFFAIFVCILTFLFDYTFFKEFAYYYTFLKVLINYEFDYLFFINKWTILICILLNIILRYIPSFIRRKYYV